MTSRKLKVLYLALLVAPILFIFASLFIGRYPVPAGVAAQIVWSKLTGIPSTVPDISATVVWDIRLPRAVLGALVGGSLAVSGASFQSLFRNPLVNSGILGVSAGAGFGASLAILLFDSLFMVYLFAFGFGFAAVILSYLIGRIYRSTPTIMLVLGGVIVSSMFQALVSFIKYVADPYEKLPAIVFWLMGSLAGARFRDIGIASIPMLVGMAGLVAVRWRINVLSMGDKEARALGVNAVLDKGLVIFCASLATAGAVCVSGTIGWVGLVIPHIGRMLVGNDNKVLIPTSIALGGCYLILVDTFGRVISGSEVPLGILTALIGGPFFVYLLKKTKGGGW